MNKNLKLLFTYSNDHQEYFTWYELEDRFVLKNENDDLLIILHKDNVVNIDYMKRIKEDYENDEFLDVVHSEI